MLRSPKASEGQGGALGEAEALKRGNTVGVRDQIMDLVAGQGLKVSRANVNLPTPTVSDQYTANLKSTQQTEGSLHSVTLAQIVNRTDLLPIPAAWGRFEPAIKLWEQILGRPAPAPTNPDGKDGNHRLSSKFTEFLMGVPEGWITDAGLTRNEELKACGNGVVPQQAAMALKILLKDLPPLTEKNRNEHRSN